jgi:nitrate reductase beta subunit
VFIIVCCLFVLNIVYSNTIPIDKPKKQHKKQIKEQQIKQIKEQPKTSTKTRLRFRKDLVEKYELKIENKLIGMTYEQAKQEYQYIRIIQKDEQRFVVTQDYKPNRLNLILKNNIVITVTRG